MPLFVPRSKWAKLTKDSCKNKCAFCDSTENLQAHHIKPKSTSPELINDLENGILLCRNCHLKAHGGSFNPVGSDKGCNDVQAYLEGLLPLVYTDGFCQHVREAAKEEGETLASYVKKAILMRMDAKKAGE